MAYEDYAEKDSGKKKHLDDNCRKKLKLCQKKLKIMRKKQYFKDIIVTNEWK